MFFNFTLCACTLNSATSLFIRVTYLFLFQTTLQGFQGTEFSVTRLHEDFEWLHDILIETEEYAGLIVSVLVAD